MREALRETLRLNRRLLIALAALMLFTLGLIVVQVGYQTPSIATAMSKWNDLRGKASALGRGDVTGAYQKGQIDLASLAERIPPKRDFPRILGELMESTAANGVSSGALTYKPETVKGENLLAYSLTMKISGRYAAVKSFLSDILSMPELIVVDGITLSNSDPFEEAVSMDLRLTVYLREGA